MAEYSGQGTPLGKVQITPRGEYVANTTYYKLDCVLYDGNSYLFTAPSGQASPAVNSNVWQLLASKGGTGPSGPTGDFGTASASVSILESDEAAYVSVYVDPSSPAYAKRFNFDFGIPAGPTGIEDVVATASWGQSGNPSALATLENKILNLEFWIPARESTSDEITVDGVHPSGYDIDLKAIRYEEGWSFSSDDPTLNSALQGRARSILNAQVAGEYIQTTGGTMFNDFNIYSSNIDGIGTFDQEGKKLNFLDASASALAYIFPKYEASNDIHSLNVITQREINNTAYENSLVLGIDNTGESVVSMSSVNAWRNALGIMPATTVPSADIAGGATGDAESFARANHAHPLNIGSDAPPQDSATGSAGSSTIYAKADHIHPLNYDDETNPAKDSGEFGFIGTPNTYALSNHAHPLNVATASALGPTSSGSAGTSNTYARSDHQHPYNFTTSYEAADLGAVASKGSLTYYARADHVHPLPTAAAIGAAEAGIWSSIPSYTTMNVTSNWTGSDPYKTILSMPNTISYSAKTIFDLRPNGTLITNMVNADVTALYIENSYPSVYLCAVGSNGLTLSNTSISFVYYESR